MSEALLTCSCCGYQYTVPEGEAIAECPACGTRNARSRAEGPSLDLLVRAIRQWKDCDFYHAEIGYQQVLASYPDAHEALWGRLMCHYGVEYIEDPITKKLMPTVHTVQRRPLRTQQDFQDACRFAPAEIRARYEKDADYIDGVQTKIRALAEKCPPYDVFLCHKTTKPGSADKTEDFHRAYKLYHFLKEQGIRAFFAPECLTDVAGANYEAGIYHALHTAKVMLVLCSEPEYLNSAWVRSEWSRFLMQMEEGTEKRLIPLLYGGFDASQLPARFRYHELQGLKMEEVDASQKLLKAVRELLPAAVPTQDKVIKDKAEPKAAPAAAKPPQQQPKPARPTGGVNGQRTTVLLPHKVQGCTSKSDCEHCLQYSKCRKIGPPMLRVGRKLIKVDWEEQVETALNIPTKIAFYRTRRLFPKLSGLLFYPVAGLFAFCGIGMSMAEELTSGLILLACIPVLLLLWYLWLRWCFPTAKIMAIPGKRYKVQRGGFTGFEFVVLPPERSKKSV